MGRTSINIEETVVMMGHFEKIPNSRFLGVVSIHFQT